MIIAHISDSHILLAHPDADQTLKDLERTIADINALDPAPDVIFHTGDIVHNGSLDEYAAAARVLEKARAPLFVIPGNKDDRANLRSAFLGHGYLQGDSKFIDYAIEDYPIRLIAVDTKSVHGNKGDFCLERAERLIAAIDADASKPVVVFTHHPPFEVPVGPEAVNFETPEMMARLRDAILLRSERVAAILSGHVHRDTSGHVGSIPATVVPPVATRLRWGDYPAEMQSTPVYHVHRLSGRGVLAMERRVAGA